MSSAVLTLCGRVFVIWFSYLCKVPGGREQGEDFEKPFQCLLVKVPPTWEGIGVKASVEQRGGQRPSICCLVPPGARRAAPGHARSALSPGMPCAHCSWSPCLPRTPRLPERQLLGLRRGASVLTYANVGPFALGMQESAQLSSVCLRMWLFTVCVCVGGAALPAALRAKGGLECLCLILHTQEVSVVTEGIVS